MERRRYLALLVTGLAGCGQQDTDSTPTPSETGTATATASPTATAASTDAPTETSTETESDTPTETPTPHPAEKQLEKIVTLLGKSTATYIEFSDSGTTFADVTADDSISVSDIRDPLYTARDHFDAFGDINLSSDQKARKKRARGSFWFLWWLASTHKALSDAHRVIGGRWGDMKEEDWGGAKAETNRVTNNVDKAEQELEKLKSDSNSEDVDVFDAVSKSDYKSKANQLESEIEDSRSISSILNDVITAFESYSVAGKAYHEHPPEYEQAANEYFNAERTFTDASDALVDRDWSDAYADIVDEVSCVVDAMAAGCELMDRAAQAGADGNEERRKTLDEDAQEEFENCNTLEENFGFGSE